MRCSTDSWNSTNIKSMVQDNIPKKLSLDNHGSSIPQYYYMLHVETDVEMCNANVSYLCITFTLTQKMIW